ncbi:DUF397 domain-containing protein [Saccharopolyspora sp. NPDC047091]|uniref:DUF397 domain-containing protein n=1 Tax=Saccharopolyspora sp. NPDC047091 TaxID=3155924 RepID=UPI0033EE6F3C
MHPDFSTAIWRTSSRSSSSGGQCVEIAFVPATADWRKASRSQGNGGACVEIAVQPSVVGIRDSKDAAGPVLAVSRDAFGAFLRAIGSGRV